MSCLVPAFDLALCLFLVVFRTWGYICPCWACWRIILHGLGVVGLVCKSSDDGQSIHGVGAAVCNGASMGECQPSSSEWPR